MRTCVCCWCSLRARALGVRDGGDLTSLSTLRFTSTPAGHRAAAAEPRALPARRHQAAQGRAAVRPPWYLLRLCARYAPSLRRLFFCFRFQVSS